MVSLRARTYECGHSEGEEFTGISLWKAFLGVFVFLWEGTKFDQFPWKKFADSLPGIQIDF